MVQCYLCKGKLRVTRDKHVYDEKLKKRYHFKCFAGICRVCDMPVYTKSKHKTIGSNVWHEQCYKKVQKTKRRKTAFDYRYYPEPGELEALGISGAKKGKYFRAKNPIKTIDDASWKAMVAARKAAGVPKKLWREFEETYFEKHPPKFEEENPRRPTREFWDKTYPGVLKGFKKRYPKAEAEERARKATAAIWYEKMTPAKKAKYERIRRKREARENPSPYDPELRRTLRKDLTKILEEARYLLVPVKGHGAVKMVEFQSLRPVPVQEGLYSVEDTPEARRTLDRLGMTYTPYRMPKADIDQLMYKLFSLRKNPLLVTPEQETDIASAFKRVVQGVGTEADRALVRMAREADVIMSTGPSVMLKRNPEEPGPAFNPVRGKVDYIIQDEFGKVYDTGTGTEEEAEARALVFNRKYMREFKVIYPKAESADVKKAAERATRDLLKR